MPTDIEIAGIAVDGLAVIELADRLLHAGHMDTAALLLIADDAGDERVGLDIRDRDAIIDVLGDTPDTLAELHGALVVEQMSRTLGNLAWPMSEAADSNFGLLAALAACVDFWVLVALTVRSLI